jgi:pSer/pThr/pTyr-binding forkhead associated (FHA) protein
MSEGTSSDRPALNLNSGIVVTADSLSEPPPSPSSSNRFGLSLSFIQRRRGNSSGDFSGNHDLVDRTPSPRGEGAKESRTGYGFPSLRRRLSRSSSASVSQELGSNAPALPFGAAGTALSGSLNASGNARPETRRTLTSELFSSRSRPHTAGGGSTQPLVPAAATFPQLTATVSLPDNVRAEEATSTNESPASASPSTTPSVPTASGSADSAPVESHHIRLVPHLESNRSLHFDPVDRTLTSFSVVSVGRFTDRSAVSRPHDPARIAFKSKVVSRGHADIWCDNGGKFFIKDTKSSSGTFLNHIRLSGPGAESRPFPVKDGDILQLGVDYQGGTEEI